eukprot:scaffold249347_cov104-Cyclotella_meneghiniana.AAC.1
MVDCCIYDIDSGSCDASSSDQTTKLPLAGALLLLYCNRVTYKKERFNNILSGGYIYWHWRPNRSLSATKHHQGDDFERRFISTYV